MAADGGRLGCVALSRRAKLKFTGDADAATRVALSQIPPIRDVGIHVHARGRRR